MNWGYRITLVFIVFAIIMLSMVYVATQQTNELQDENYYDKELVYQTVIDGRNNLAAAGNYTLRDSSDNILLQIPTNIINTISDGSIYFLCPSDKKSDVVLPFAPNANGLQLIPKSKFRNTLYTVRVSWKNDGKPFYIEQPYRVE
ncbi:MAG TPA: FixH family protein [Chitinophagales bacterium]|jgi:hypothetical protein|nr:FixH family protein [Chitinophagales bacterium]